MSFFSKFRQQVARCINWGSAIALGTGLMVVLHSSRADAAKEIIITYGPVAQSVTVKDLTTFAETGEMSSSIRFLLDIANQNPEEVRQILTQELEVGMVFLSDVLNTLPGEYGLFEVGQVIHTKSRRANIQSLRGALVISAYKDNTISLLEFFQNYPTQQMYIDGYKLSQRVNTVSTFVNRVGKNLEVPLAIAKDLLSTVICECESPATSQVNLSSLKQ